MTKAHLHLQSVQRFIPLETTEDEPPESAPTRKPARCAETVAAADPAPAAIRRSRRHESGRQLTLQCAVAGRPVIPPVTSPHAGATAARQALSDRFAQRVAFNPEFTRRTVSYQGNRRTPGLRWMKYKEGFSRALVDYLLDEYKPDRVLDPFAGIGTTALVAAGRGIEATGIEIMPIGVLAGAGVAAAANGLSRGAMDETANAIRKRTASARPAAAGHAFPHVRITEAAFPVETESALGKAREFVAEMQDGPAKTLVNLACMSVLEAVSYTRKDGQYLTRPSGAARRRRDHDQRQRAVSRGGSAGRLHPLRPRRTVGIHLRRHLDACAGQGEREPADGKVRATRNPQVRLPLGPEAMTARDDLMRRSKESV